MISGAEAKALGLVSRVVPHEELLPTAMALAHEIAANPPLVVQGVKQVMNQRLEGEIAQGLRYVGAWNSAFLHSEDLLEAIASFRERRPPQFKGR